MQDVITRVEEFVLGRGRRVTEGSASADELAWFVELVRSRPEITLVGEIGFNAGLSSYAFLSSRPDVQVVSFDIGLHDYVTDAKAFIDQEFPGRHRLVLGDSRETVPAYAREGAAKFDLFFVDGGHDYEIARTDLANARLVTHKRSLILIDDLTPWVRWGKGPTQAWDEALAQRWLVQEGLYRNGDPVDDYDGTGDDRIWAIARIVRTPWWMPWRWGRARLTH